MRIKDVFTRVRGTPITANQMKSIQSPDGDILIIAGGKTSVFAFEKDIPNANITRVPAVLIQSRGIIDAVYLDQPFTFKNEMWAYTTTDTSLVRYLYHYLKNNIQKLRDIGSAMGSMPQISIPITDELLIPVIKPEFMSHIVKILDKFEELCNSISAGLPAEISARQKQYEYYRDKLLSFTPEHELIV